MKSNIREEAMSRGTPAAVPIIKFNKIKTNFFANFDKGRIILTGGCCQGTAWKI